MDQIMRATLPTADPGELPVSPDHLKQINLSLSLFLSPSLLSGRALENSVQFTVALGFRICAKRKRTEEHPTL